MLKVMLAKSYAAAQAVADNGNNWVVIETEYGGQTLGIEHPNVLMECNHHGELQANEAPSLSCYQCQTRYDNFIISHIDLDVLYGMLWAAGWLKKTKTTMMLAKLIAKADVDGFHVIDEELKRVPQSVKEKYLAIGYLVNSWVFNDDGQDIKDISKETHKLLLRIKDIIIDGVNPEQIALYEKWFNEQQKVVKDHLLDVYDLCDEHKLFIYRAKFSLTSAYTIDDLKASMIVQYNEQSKSITLSCYDENVATHFFGEKGVIAPLTQFFGEGAGGKKTIGGTPREINIQPEMLQAFINFLLREYLNIPEIEEVTL
jgi:hypothetical protein